MLLLKIINGFKLWFSYHSSRISGKNWHWGNPLSISVEPTTHCNLRCPECPSGLRAFTRPTGMLSEELFKRLIDENKKHLTYLTFYFQGEPYLNPSFLKMANYAVEKGIYTSTSTNAHYLDEENARKTIESGMQQVIISVDGASQSTYEQYRVGGELEKVKLGVQNLILARKNAGVSHPKIIMQCVIFKHNEHEIVAMKKMADDWKVDELQLKTAQIYDFENGNERIPTLDQYSRYRKNAKGKWEIKNKLLNQCWRMWSSCVITWDGKVVPCCFDKDAKYQMGDLNKNSLNEVWRNNNYADFRSKILHSRSQIDICKNCSEGTKVFEKD